MKSRLGSSTNETHKFHVWLFLNLGHCSLTHKTRPASPRGESSKVRSCISMASPSLKSWKPLCICWKGSSDPQTFHQESENNRHAVTACKHRQRYGARHFLIYGASQILNRALI